MRIRSAPLQHTNLPPANVVPTHLRTTEATKSIRCSAPGKIVLWGEYAVLDGAPACVMAVDRLAQVRLNPHGDAWHFTTAGFTSRPHQQTSAKLPTAAAAGFTRTICEYWGVKTLSKPFAMHSDSSDFFLAAEKLGLGSSAAICCATYAALAYVYDRPATLAEALAIHRIWQGGRGSGLDIACSWLGGTIRFASGEATSTAPVAADWLVVWVGNSTSTATNLGGFSAWRNTADVQPLTALGDASAALFHDFTTATLLHYVSCLERLDEVAKLNIFTAAHRTLVKLAAVCGLTYKPCGAGGGDVGIAFALHDDASARKQALQRFQDACTEHRFFPLDLGTTQHGIRVDN